MTSPSEPKLYRRGGLSRNSRWQTLPTFAIVKSAAKEARRVHPNWSLHECVMHGYMVALEDMNAKEYYK